MKIRNITLSGIADESGDTIDKQIAAHKELGWSAIELRLINGKNVCGELSDAEFDSAAEKLEKSGLEVTGFGSAIGNWSRPITGDFAIDIQELKTAIKRMNRLGVKYIRTMSWLQDSASETEWRKQVIVRYKELTKIAEDYDIILAHENCTGWAGLGGENMRELIDEVDSSNLTLLFDIGNTISHGYKPWEFYSAVKGQIGYVHIKDCKVNPKGGRSQNYAYPGAGDALLDKILTNLFSSGYQGVVSIEPHVAKIVHDANVKPDSKKMHESYIKYAKLTEKLVRSAAKHEQGID